MKIIEVIVIVLIVGVILWIGYTAISGSKTQTPVVAQAQTPVVLVTPTPRPINHVFTQNTPVEVVGLSQRQINKRNRRNF